MMTRWWMFVTALLVGCASGGARNADDPARARAIAKIHTELASAYYEREQYAVALQEVSVALKADPNYAPGYVARALIRMALREDEQAEEDFRKSLSLDGESSEIHNNYGWFLCQRGREKESFEHFRTALKNPLYPTPELAYLNLGICYKRAGQTKEADINLQRALILRPGMPEALYALAELSYDTGDYPGARSYFLKLAQKTPELSPAQLWLGVRIERKMRDQNAAASYALQLRKRYPDSREAQLLLQGE